MVTTIQLNEGVKQDLKNMKKSSNETYEDVIVRMIKKTKKDQKEFEELMIEGYKETAEESLRICEEFKYVDAEGLPEWEWD